MAKKHAPIQSGVKELDSAIEADAVDTPEPGALPHPHAAPRSASQPQSTAQVAVDARVLQDERYVSGDIGSLCVSLLRARPTDLGLSHVVAVTDPTLPPLEPDLGCLFDHVQTVPYLDWHVSALLTLSPMTHSAVPFARTLTASFFRAAIVYDFIPLDHPERYLPSEAQASEYAARLLWLSKHDRFYSISDFTKSRLHDLIDIPIDAIVTTGIGVRDGLVPGGQPGVEPDPALPYFIVSAGEDWRKNVEAPLRAHARSAILNHGRVRIVVTGGFGPARRAELRGIHGASGGNPALLEFKDHLPDAELRVLYAGALATIVPSRAEGFSLPIVEASVNKCPVIAANCPAQAELLGSTDDLFDPEDVTDLQLRMEQLSRSDRRAEMLDRQAAIGPRFSNAHVCQRFWNDFARYVHRHAANHRNVLHVNRGARPVIAFATPLPPARSGVADYSAATLAELAKIADVRVYTPTQKPVLRGAPVTSIEPLSPVAYLSGQHDAVVSVLGNSHLHSSIFHELMTWGGASIAHDSRMLNFYFELLGTPRTLTVAEAELQRSVDSAEIDAWLGDQRKLGALFLSEIAGASRPMFVHSPVTAALLIEQNTPCTLLPFSPYRILTDEQLGTAAREEARRRLGIPEDAIIVSTFGGVMMDRAIEDCLWAIEVMRSWGVPATFACIGAVEPPVEEYLRNIARAIGVNEYLIMSPNGVSEEEYRLWLQAADVAIQLRTYKMGGLSGALMDCIAAGLPVVANRHLATAMDAPQWVRQIPDFISAVLIAETLVEILDAGTYKDRRLDQRRGFLERRSFTVYARQLVQGLGFSIHGVA